VQVDNGSIYYAADLCWWDTGWWRQGDRRHVQHTPRLLPELPRPWTRSVKQRRPHSSNRHFPRQPGWTSFWILLVLS